jgi:hypothetical protein
MGSGSSCRYPCFAAPAWPYGPTAGPKPPPPTLGPTLHRKRNRRPQMQVFHPPPTLHPHRTYQQRSALRSLRLGGMVMVVAVKLLLVAVMMQMVTMTRAPQP